MKKILAILMVLLLACSFTGCSDEANSDTKVAGYDILDSGILKEMAGANNFDVLMEKYGKITLYAVARDGGEYYIHLEEIENGYNYYLSDATGVEGATTPKGQFIVTSDGDEQTYVFASEEEYKTVEAGAVESVRNSMYKYNETENVVVQEEKDGYLVVTTAVHMTDEIDGYLEFKSAWGIEDEEFDFFNDYVLNKDTLEIVENRTYCQLSTGRVDSGKVTITYGQDYEISDTLKACMEKAE